MKRLADSSILRGAIDVEKQLLYASSSARAVIEDICASVSEFLRSRETALGTDAMNWAYSLLWPLSAARASGHVPAHLIDHLRHQIQTIWDVTGFSIADYHKKDLGVDVEPENWSVSNVFSTQWFADPLQDACFLHVLSYLPEPATVSRLRYYLPRPSVSSGHQGYTMKRDID